MISRIKKCCGSLWRLTKVYWQMLYGMWYVSRLEKPIVTIFGGARFNESDFYFKKAHELGERLVEENISVLTGGGPGIMQGANCGAIKPNGKKARSLGITVADLGEEPNECAQEVIELDYFFARKWLLISFSQAFVVFPGGFGTLDEMAEVLTLIQMKRLPRTPIILYGVEFWTPFIQWLEREAIEHGTIDSSDLALFELTDDLEKVFCLVRDECKLNGKDPNEKD